MNRYDLYNIVKEMLCKHGLIPKTEKEYEELVIEIVNLVE